MITRVVRFAFRSTRAREPYILVGLTPRFGDGARALQALPFAIASPGSLSSSGVSNHARQPGGRFVVPAAAGDCR